MPPLDEDAIRSFMTSDLPALVANLMLVTGSREEAEDAAQEALARLWVRIEQGDMIRSPRAWVGVVAMNLCRSRLRRLRVERRAGDLLVGVAEEASLGPADVETRALASELRAAVAALPRRQREVIALRYFLDLDVGEVARALSISTGTAKKALHRARETLAGALEAPEGDQSDVAHR